MKRVTLLGSTGSIGQSTLDVIRGNSSEFGIFALVAGRNLASLVQQILEFQPSAVAVPDEDLRRELSRLLAEAGAPLNQRPEILAGEAAYARLATAPETDFLMSAIVGVAGMEATYEAAKLGKRIGLANKETLVAGGDLVMDAVRHSGAELLPVDSEHNGAHQCFRAGRPSEVTKLILTASGGPFRQFTKAEMANVTPEQALNHPTWKMGPRITIDSATLMNKGFEVIEACRLFGLPPSRVEVVVHPQSTVHAMVEYNDGSVIAQVCATDMRMPIQYALTYPDRAPAPVPRLDWKQPRTWEFHEPDFGRFPLLGLAYQALETGGTATCTLNAADEIAVEAFLAGRLSFPAIAEVVEETLAFVPSRQASSIQEVLETDRASRDAAREIVRKRADAGLRQRVSATGVVHSA